MVPEDPEQYDKKVRHGDEKGKRQYSFVRLKNQDLYRIPEEVILERPLGSGENLYRCRTELGFYHNFASVAAYSRDVSQDLGLLYRALRKSIIDYHLLICNVFKELENGASLIRPIKYVALGDLVEFATESFSPRDEPVSEKCLHDLCRTPFFKLNVEKPLFRVFIFGTHDVGATFEHTLFDGVVASLFQEILLENLAFCDYTSKMETFIQLYGPIPEEIELSTNIFNYEADKKYLRNSLPPPLEMVMQDPAIDYSDNDPSHYSKLIPKDYPEKWPGRFPATKEFSVAFKTFGLTPDEMAPILKKCKENGVTFTSYFNVIQMLALQPIFGDKHYTSNVMAITLRRFLSPEKVTDGYKDILQKEGYRILGNYAHSGVPDYFSPLKTFSWNDVQEINWKMGQSVKNDKLLNMRKDWYEGSSLVGENREFFESAIGQNKGESVKTSNLGLAKFPVYRMGDGKLPWTVNDIVFAQDLTPHASEFVVNLISSPRGGLKVVVTYYNQRFDDSEYENFDMFPGVMKELLLQCAK